MGRKRKHDLDAHIMVVEENGRPEMYIEVDGKRIAKRGHADSPQARTWISLDPEWVVRDRNYPHGIEIEQRPAIMQ